MRMLEDEKNMKEGRMRNENGGREGDIYVGTKGW